MQHNPDYSSQIPGGWTAAAENVAQGQPTAAQMNADWMNSPGTAPTSSAISPPSASPSSPRTARPGACRTSPSTPHRQARRRAQRSTPGRDARPAARPAVRTALRQPPAAAAPSRPPKPAPAPPIPTPSATPTASPDAQPTPEHPSAAPSPIGLAYATPVPRVVVTARVVVAGAGRDEAPPSATARPDIAQPCPRVDAAGIGAQRRDGVHRAGEPPRPLGQTPELTMAVRGGHLPLSAR